MTWTVFVGVLLATVVGNAIWQFLTLWLVKQNWYRTILMKLSTELTRKAMEEFED